MGHFFPGQPLLYFVAFITFPVAVAKTAQALLQVHTSTTDVANTLLLMTFRQISKGYIAAVNLVEVDTKEREQLRKDNLKME